MREAGKGGPSGARPTLQNPNPAAEPGRDTAAQYQQTPESVFETLPRPQSPPKKRIDDDASGETRRFRAATLPKIAGGVRALYRTLELPGQDPLKDAHAALDAGMLEAYGFANRTGSVSDRPGPLPDGRGSDQPDLLAQLLALNLEVAARLDRGQPVTAPGVPPSYGDPSPLITDDCIRP